MLDSKFIRENLAVVQESIKKKKVDVNLDKFVELDEQRKKLQTKLDNKRAEQNKASAKIFQAGSEERVQMISAVGNLKNEIKELDADIKLVLKE